VLYSINPATGPKLQRVSVSGQVPPFSPSMSATALSSQIVIYGSSTTGAVSSTFNSFDTVAAAWSGPGLVQPAALPSPSASSGPQPSNDGSNNSGSGNSSSSSKSSSNVGAIAGGVAGGLVVIALVIFFFFRHRRRSNAAAAAAAAPTSTPALNTASNPTYLASPSLQLQQQQQQQQQPFQQQQQQQQMQQAYAYVTPQLAPAYNPHNSYMPYVDSSKDAYSPAPHHPSPLQQPSYSYTPPTLGIAAVEPQNPNIFQPHSASSDNGSNPSYSQAQYTPSTSAATPQTPYTPVANQAHTPSTGPSSPQYLHNNNHGYVS